MSAAAAILTRTTERYTQGQVRPENTSLVPKLEKIARIFAEVFADPPWGEYKVCPDKHYVSKENGDLTKCPKKECGQALELAYPVEKVMEQIYREAGSKKGGSLVVVEDASAEPCAFGWGCAATDQELVNDFHTQDMQQKGLGVISPYMKDGKIFYLTELLVVPSARGQGIATQIAESLVDKARELNLNVVLHTHCDSPMAHIAEKIGMLPILNKGEYTPNPGRITFAKRL